jgi:hypothetical protein
LLLLVVVLVVWVEPLEGPEAAQVVIVLLLRANRLVAVLQRKAHYP